MDENRWASVNEVFHRALELEGEARTQYLLDTCRGDGALLSEVRSLLDADARAQGFLQTPAGAAPEPAPTEVGPWRIVRELGRGGMGTVYLAERADGAFTMQAALKLIRRGLDTDDLLARFRDERQILASLQHPNIARLLDGGAVPDGRPWLAMEYVEGDSLLDWSRGVDQRARLALFRTLCGAVQYAHRNLVVHRDLKPGNVLVTKAGEPKLLDFGIARVLGGAPGDERTKTGQQVLTTAYASPEQVRGERVTTAADVWALGVILYELLVGQRPFQGEGQALARAILEHDLPPPRLGAELDAVLFTALRKEPERRYPSVEALADDLARLEKGLPLRARSPTVGYRLGKFVRRNRLAVGAAALVVLSLGGGVVATALQAREAREARARAEASRARAEELVDFMLGDLRSKLEPSSRLDVLEDVAKAVQTYFDTEPDGAPERRARTLQQLATVRLAQARQDDAAALVAASRAALEQAPATADVDVLRAAAANLQAQVLEAKGDLDGALPEYERARALLQSVLGRKTPDGRLFSLAVDSHNDVGRVLYALGRPADAVTAHEAALTLSRSLELPGRHALFARAKSSMYLGRAREALGELARAQGAFEQTLELARRLHADFPQDTELEDFLAISLNDLGRVLRLLGKPGDAEPLAVEALGFSEAALARDPENALRLDGLSASHSFLGRAREELGKLEAAHTEFEADVKISERLLGKAPDDAFVQAALADGLTNVGRVERKLGALERSRRAHERALALREGLVAKDAGFQPDLGVSHLELARLLRAEKKDPTTELEKALVIFKAVGGAPDAPAKQRGRLAQVLLELGRVDEARPLVLALLDAKAADAELRALWSQHAAPK